MALRTHRLLHLVCEFDVRAPLREADGLHIVHAAHAQPAFHRAPWQAEILLPIGDESYAAEMAARGVPPDIEVVTITIEFVSISINPGDSATHLLSHNTEITVSLLYCNEVKRNIVRTGIDNHFRWEGVVLCLSNKPSPTVNHHKDRCLEAFRAIDIQFLNGRRAIRLAHWLSDATAHCLTSGG